MEKEFVAYELAVKLKELGFDEGCFGYYEPNKNLNYIEKHILKDFPYLAKNSEWQDLCAAPTFSQAFRWFREKYHIIGEVKFKGGKTTKTAWYDYVIYSEIDWNDENPSEQWKTYEEAELHCLQKLIEIVESK